MSDSEEENSSESLKQDRMSVSDHEQELSRDENDMPLSEDMELHDPEGSRHGSTASDSSFSDSEGNKNPVLEKQGQKDPILVEMQLPTLDMDYVPIDLMTGSYSEILSPVQHQVSPVVEEASGSAIQDLENEGTLLQDGGMIHFVAKNLETKIRLTSPEVPENPKAAIIDELNMDPEFTLLANLEKEARNIASSIDVLTEHLVISLHTISAVTVESLTVYKDCVCKNCDAMDANIKSMYQLMAKCEELSKAMAPLYKQAEQVKEIKKLLDIMENIF